MTEQTIAIPRSLRLCDVQIGDTLPTLVVPITPRVVIQGAASTRDWQPQHHDYEWAMAKTGSNVFLNTPNQAGWIERYLTDWAGPKARLGKLAFDMKATSVPGDDLTFNGEVTAIDTDEHGTTFVDVALELSVEGTVKTFCTARLAIPTDDGDNPWTRDAATWKP